MMKLSAYFLINASAEKLQLRPLFAGTEKQPVQPDTESFESIVLPHRQAGVNDFNVFSYRQVPFLLFSSCAAGPSLLRKEMIQTCMEP